VNGIILIGGESKRMGQPKALLRYQGKTLVERSIELLSNCCSNVYISGKVEQIISCTDFSIPFIADKYTAIGPIGGIVSSFETVGNPERGLLVLATDMPLMDLNTLSRLISQRDTQKYATMYIHKNSGYLEPLCAIYEPSAYLELKKAIFRQEYSMQRIFDRDQLNLIGIKTPDTLKNINTPEDLENIQK